MNILRTYLPENQVLLMNEYTLLSDFGNVAKACDFVKKFCIENNMPEIDSISFVICINEALNNVIKHSYLSKPGNKIKLNIYSESDSIRVEIIDFGIARTNPAKKSLDFDPNDIDNLPESGMGLFIIDSLTDKSEYRTEDDRNILELTKNITS